MSPLIISYLILSSSNGTVMAQFGPEVYAVVRPISAAKIPGSLGRAMGGCWVTTNETASYNPANLSMVRGPSISLKHYQISFKDSDHSRIETYQEQASWSVGKDKGALLAFAQTRSSSQPFTLLDPTGYKDLNEDAVAVGYGQRLSSELSVGVMAAPVMRIKHRFGILPGVDIAGIDSQISLKGLRFGARYQPSSDFWLAGVYDNFTDKVELTDLISQAIIPSQFHSTNVVLGVGVRIDNHTTIHIERERGTLSGNGSYTNIRYWHFGAERRIYDQNSLLLGFDQGSLSMGVKLNLERARVVIGYANNIYPQEFGPLFGQNSRTTFLAVNWSID